MSAEALLEDPTLFVGNVRYDFDYRYQYRHKSSDGGITYSSRSRSISGSCSRDPVASSASPNRADHALATAANASSSSNNTPTDFALEYLGWAHAFPPSDFYKCVKAHVLKLVHRPLRLAQGAAAQGAAAQGAEVQGRADGGIQDCAAGAATTAAAIEVLHLAVADVVANEAVAAGTARAAVLAASNETELAAGVHALDAFMRRRGQNVSPPCSLCALSCADSGAPPPPPGYLAEECACWRRDTWYQRHRDQVRSAGEKKRQSESSSSEVAGAAEKEGGDDAPAGDSAETHAVRRATRSDLKEMRRQKYRAMGFNV
jgi:hypothetical protein